MPASELSATIDAPKRGMVACTQKNTKSCRVDGIVYKANPHNRYATNSHVDIYVAYAYYNPKYEGIGQAVVI
jgi:hypothetical protein